MKKVVLFATLLLLMGCASGQSSDSSNSIGGGRDSTTPTFAWKDEVKLIMENALGEYIPYLDSFGNSYHHQTGYMDSSSIPYINPYWEGANAKNYTVDYIVALENNDYTFVNEDVDESDATCIWKNYAKSTNIGDLYVRFSYYHSLVNGAKTAYFEIYAWLENDGGGGLVMPDEVDFVFDAESFGAKNVSYDKSNTEFEVLNATVKAANIMNSDNKIQMKKLGATLFNIDALAPIKYLYLNGLSVYGQSNYVEVLAGDSRDKLKTVTTYNDIYNLAGATYFEIKTNNRQVVRLDYIEFSLVR